MPKSHWWYAQYSMLWYPIQVIVHTGQLGKSVFSADIILVRISIIKQLYMLYSMLWHPFSKCQHILDCMLSILRKMIKTCCIDSYVVNIKVVEHVEHFLLRPTFSEWLYLCAQVVLKFCSQGMLLSHKPDGDVQPMKWQMWAALVLVWNVKALKSIWAALQLYVYLNFVPAGNDFKKTLLLSVVMWYFHNIPYKAP